MQTGEIMTGNFAPWRLWPPAALRVVSWNIDRGQQLEKVVTFLKESDADVLLLQEVDLNARRTHHINVARAIAERLRMNFVFGREFVELSQGTKQEPAYQGQATLAKWRLTNARLINFRRQSSFWRPRWFIPKSEPFQERLGGRVALVADVNIAGETVRTYNLHLESRGNDDLRLSQLEEVVLDATRADVPPLVIIAGDLNLDASKHHIMGPLERAGLRVASPTARVATTHFLGLPVAAHHIDWIFIRGALESDGGNIDQSVNASDHYPVSTNLRRSR